MVIVRLMGGLGNQLFQYATGLAVSHRCRVPLKLDLSWFDNNSARKYRLDKFSISASVASQVVIAQLTGSCSKSIRAKVFALLQRLRPYYQHTILQERQFLFDPNIFRISKKAYLIGYWQSEKYFKDIERIIRQEFKLQIPPDPLNKALAKAIQSLQSVSVHIRRGDYVTNPNFQRIYDVCPLEYYNAAASYISKRIEKPKFYIFSDDIEWVQTNYDFEHPATYIHNCKEKDYEVLRLMSHCKHHIIANSTFSWWGAWLSNYPNKIVIAPQKWFKDSRFDTRDLVPERWIQM